MEDFFQRAGVNKNHQARIALRMIDMGSVGAEKGFMVREKHDFTVLPDPKNREGPKFQMHMRFFLKDGG